MPTGTPRPFIEVTPEKAKAFVSIPKKKAANRFTPSQQNDRDYLMGFLKVFRSGLSEVSDQPVKPPKGHNPTFTPRQMCDNILQYFETALEAGQPITLLGTRALCHIDKDFLYDTLKGKHPEYQFLRPLHDFIEFYNEYALHKKQNPAGPIFILKNFGWKDKFEIEASSTQGALTEEERELAQKRIQAFSEIKGESLHP